MLHWTKTKPNKSGYWWSKCEDTVEIFFVSIIKNIPYIVDRGYSYIIDEAYDSCLWSSSSICEPIGGKI